MTYQAPQPPTGERPDPIQTLGLIDVAGMINAPKVDGKNMPRAEMVASSGRIRESMNKRADELTPAIEAIIKNASVISFNEGDASRPQGLIIQSTIEGKVARVTVDASVLGKRMVDDFISDAIRNKKAIISPDRRLITSLGLRQPLSIDLRKALTNCIVDIEHDAAHTESLQFRPLLSGKVRDLEWIGMVQRGGLTEKISVRETNPPGQGEVLINARRINRQSDHITNEDIDFDGKLLKWQGTITYADLSDPRSVIFAAHYTPADGWIINSQAGSDKIPSRDAALQERGIVAGGHDIPEIRRIYESAAGAIPVPTTETQIVVQPLENAQGLDLLGALAKINQGGTQNIHEAITALESQREKYGDNSTLHSTLALAYGRDGDYARCLQEYQEALRLDPKNGDAAIITPQPGEDGEATYDRLHHAGQELLKLGKPQEALRYYEAAVAIKGGGHLAPWSLFDKGVALSQLKHFEEAAQQLLDVRGLLPGNTWVDSRIGMVYEAWTSRAGNKAEAKSFYEAALVLDPTNAEAKEGLERVK